ncbi:uncharacterized protein N0V89_010253 [Didymosphaeria variabile]|uniref:MFS general substrate transporter n=1 Tax=Didymosphaeria variabile TaxID=1932322 RepID=A0A9W9C602_9PLEO|nr:uncharacterized protein N0V89_010253 [Didymosphaeria variabile]KAJ4346324.1 hypothetical protein N0V89_010253 [Didymosphaeria variabile]
MKPSEKEMKDPTVADTMNDGNEDFAVGSTEQLAPTKYTMGKFYRSVLFQMVLFGCLSFVGPAMSDAISNLGGGGLSSPWLANLANSLNYACSFLVTIIGGPLVNKIGIKWACFIAALAMPLYGSAYYVNARFSVDWYLLASNIIGGVASGFLYVGETTAMLSYPSPEDRGFYLGIWSAMRNSGSVIGGAINFSNNHSQSTGGGIAWVTYLIFLGFECTGVIWALLLSKTAKVRRRDNSKILISKMQTWKQEFVSLGHYLRESKTWLVFVPAFYSFFYGGTLGTYLSLHFSVRSRALSSLIVPSITIPSVIGFGRFLDNQRWSQRTRAWIAFMLWVIPQTACFIWINIENHQLGKKSALDYSLDGSRWAKAYMPYLIIFVSGYWTQLTLYWVLGTFSNKTEVQSRAGGVFRAFEVAGQAISYGINSNKTVGYEASLYINTALLVLVVPAMIALISKVPLRPMVEEARGLNEAEGRAGEGEVGKGE